MSEKKTLLTEKEASEIIKLKPGSLRQRRTSGKPPSYVKIGRSVYYDKKVLEEFIVECIREPEETNLDE